MESDTQINVDSYSTNEGVHFSFFHHSPRFKLFLTLRGVSIFYTKIRISRQKRNQKRNYF